MEDRSYRAAGIKALLGRFGHERTYEKQKTPTFAGVR
jgi:hypothetical protein